MDRQLIISIGREFGSGGHAIADLIAGTYNLPMYDHNLLDNMAKEKGYDGRELNKYDEQPDRLFGSRTVLGFSNSLERNVAEMQFEFIREKAGKGESFVVVGRCSEFILKDNPYAVKIFIIGDMASKIERIKEIYGLSQSEAKDKIIKMDKVRKAYHDSYCEGKWGDSRFYDITLNSSRLGIEGSAEIIGKYIDEYIMRRKNG